MKKTTAALLLLFVAMTAGAQTKVNKTNVVGNWKMYSVEVPGQLYYNIEKDSLSLGDAVKSSIDPSQLEMTTSVIKQQFAMFAKATFAFNADGSTNLVSPTGEKENGTWSVDETKATITTTKKGDTKSETLTDASVTDNGTKLQFTSTQGQGDVRLVLKKM